MNAEKSIGFLFENADAPIRYRVLREIVMDERAARKMEEELLENAGVKLWLKNLRHETPPQHWSMEHGSFDFCLENALLKGVQLGLHCGLSQVADAVQYYADKIALHDGAHRGNVGFRKGVENMGFYSMLTANLLTLAGHESEAVRNYMLGSLDELYSFVSKGSRDIYASGEERAALKGIPAIWKEKKFIKRALVEENGFCFPFIYDIVGLHKLYGGVSPETDEKIDAIIRFISADEFHETVACGYGILISGDRKYHAMGWDPKYPGWFDVERYMERGGAPKLLFFAQYISKYPAARETKWFGDLMEYLSKFRTESGYKFPAVWLKETRGYAVQGSHISFGENRLKKNWREIESTFYMLLINSDKER